MSERGDNARLVMETLAADVVNAVREVESAYPDLDPWLKNRVRMSIDELAHEADVLQTILIYDRPLAGETTP